MGMLLLLLGAIIAYPAPQDMSIAVGPAHHQQVTPGQVVVYDHVLTNTGTLTDTFLIEVASTQGWPVTLIGAGHLNGTVFLPVAVSPQMTLSFQVSLTVPVDVFAATEVTLITATSQLSPTIWDATTDTSIVVGRLYLPFLTRRWPPLPYQPSLAAIQDAEYGRYTVAWSESPSRIADTYILQEATDAAFTTNLRDACTTTESSCMITDRVVGTYYYRVRGQNNWGASAWSNIQVAQVVWLDTPTTFIENFSNPNSGWDTGKTVFGSAYYVNGEYRLTDPDDIGGVTLFEGISPDWIAPNDLEIKVEARIDEGTTCTGCAPAMSLVFGLKTFPWEGELYWVEWYEFRVSPQNQAYWLWKWSNWDELEQLTSGTSSAILPNPQVMQTLEVHRSGDTITMLINGTELESFVDYDNPYSGRRSVGLGGGDFRVATYDNFQVSSSGLITKPIGTR